MNATLAIDTQRIKDAIDLRDLADRYTTLRRESASELAGPCPRCGGDDRFHVQRGWFFCRQCHPKHGDAIAFAQWVGLAGDFRSACELLSAGSAPVTDLVTKRKPERRAAPVERSEDWQQNAQKLVKNAEKLLRDSQMGETVQAELERRSLSAQTCAAWRLGAVMRYHPATKEKRPAIVVPWLEPDSETVQAVQFRFVGVTKEEGRFSQLKGSDRHIFGLHRLREQPVLIICEGELNAVSIWQEKPGVDVVSFGPEDNARGNALELLTGLAIDYQHVIVWADKLEIAKVVQAALPGAFGFRSPIESGEKVDTNDWLQRDKLNWLLTGLLEKVTGSGQQPAEPEPGVLGYYTTFAEGWVAYQAAIANGVDAGLSRVGKGHGLFVLNDAGVDA